MSRQSWEGYFEAMKEQQWHKALEALTHIVKAEDDNALVHLRIGDICQRLGDTTGAVKAYHRSAEIQAQAGFQHKALALYRIILRIRPADAAALSRSAALLRALESARVPGHPVPPPDELPRHEERPVPAAEPAPATVQRDDMALTEAVIGGSGIASLDALFPEAPDKGLQQTFGDLLVPLSERQAATTVAELFAGMAEEEVSAFLNGLEVCDYPDRAAVIEEGDSGDSLFMIKSGSAKVIAHMFGRELELARLGEGDLFGEVAFLTGRPRTASVIATGPLSVYEIGRLDIEELIEHAPEVMARLEGFYETRVRDTIKKILPGPR